MISKDGPATETPRKGTRTRTIPVEVWLGDGVSPGLIDMDPEMRREVLEEARGPNPWGPPEWTREDERRWQNLNSR